MSSNLTAAVGVDSANPSSQVLAKKLTWLMVLAFGLAGEVGAGIFAVSAQVQGIVPGVGSQVPLAIFVDGFIALTLAFTYWFFSGSMAGAGGEYLFISRTLGARFGFIVHVISWFGSTASIGFLAYTAPTFLASALNSITKGLGSPLLSTDGEIIAGLAMIWIAWALHVRGIRLVGIILQIAMGVILFAGLLVMIVGFSHSPANLLEILAAKTHLSPAILMNGAPRQTSFAFFMVLPVLYYAYSGLRGATYTGGETPNAKRVLGKSILLLVLLVTAFYTLFAAALYHLVPWQLLSGLLHFHHKSLASASALVGLFLPAWLSVLLNFAVALIVFKTILPGMMGQSRMMLAFSADGILPDYFKRLSIFQTPMRTLTTGAIMSSLILIQTAFTGTAFGLASSVLAGTIVHFALGLGVLKLPKAAPMLYASNNTWLKQHRNFQILLGWIQMIIAISLAYLVVLPSLGSVWYFNPLFQVLLFAMIGFLLYNRYWRAIIASNSIEEHRNRFGSESIL
ncbi:APC family permease [Sulfoacidibacillus thermotolerans]|uniref:Amino acid permease n=1 Tax=Sulfoacidibacillus thermotolerans TaxID=1765684 RepID=A0A2U3D744_SULT2|nr:APC family permease [Sulfoacidibacillus thermotolerans]PWI57102.1 hypothetical protein BM613_10105 [Sulfoacidibacillus thermotolerans]